MLPTLYHDEVVPKYMPCKNDADYENTAKIIVTALPVNTQYYICKINSLDEALALWWPWLSLNLTTDRL